MNEAAGTINHVLHPEDEEEMNEAACMCKMLCLKLGFLHKYHPHSLEIQVKCQKGKHKLKDGRI